jgi:hypothetical protein
MQWIDYGDVVRQTISRRQRSEVRMLEHTLTAGAWIYVKKWEGSK